jgi:hypothetical protein
VDTTHQLVSGADANRTVGVMLIANRLAKNFNCPTEFTLQVLGGKWKTVLLAYLKIRPLRYAELRKLTPKLSDKMLSQRLRELTRAKSLSRVLTELYTWGEANAAEFGVNVGQPLRRLDQLPIKEDSTSSKTRSSLAL